MIGIKLTQIGERIGRWGERKSKEVRKAMDVAVSVEAFRLMVEGKKALRAGTLGLKNLSLYQNIPGDPRYKRPKKSADTPLKNLSWGLRYKAIKGELRALVGYSSAIGSAQRAQIYAERSASGYMIPISEAYRKTLHERGIHLKPSTTSIPVPERNIIDAVYAKFGGNSLQNIKNNFAAKMRGERI